MIKKEGLFATDTVTKSDRCIHTPGSFAKQNLLYVQEVGFLQSLQPHRCIRENLDSFLFLIVLEGKGTLSIKGTNYVLEKGSCAFIDCMEHYEHISDEENAWQLGWVHFNGHGARGYYELFLKYHQGSQLFEVEDIAEWKALVEDILITQKARNFQAELKCGELLTTLLNKMVMNVINVGELAYEQEKMLVNELREQLNEQYAASDVLVQMEQHFGEKLKELRKGFAKQYGISIEEYIANRRFNAAKELLRFSVKPIDEVAKESGIMDLVAMQQLFRENEGMSAEEYRMKWAQWIR